jgi:hypothetical protein
MPERIQVRRTKGWRKPDGAIVVARPSKWGNPVRIVDGFDHDFDWRIVSTDDWCSCHSTDERMRHARAEAVRRFRLVLTDGYENADDWPFPFALTDLAELRGHDLACWCPLDQPCHADVLLELANAPSPNPDGEP